ncbi:WS/DGAT domain-containing protein [Gordonia sp. ABSL1-1]|uniref:WS/DGAT domain-containing protein n=1 Tax=Gordonia sp. ABSL1-1 TaxID=3053923 RepID=UPI0025732996|nr:WS/DGAT domain-containing protein [Gordonia sp. ABSL1-1]MDL9935698.1 WS/DGAT domain-containing protein [Gordonia sp. ABSL1-1]
MQRMAHADAVSYWMSASIPNDQFLLYCFADPGMDLDGCAIQLWARARAVPDLNLRIVDVPGALDHPYWVDAPARAEQVVVHTGSHTWQSCLDVLGATMREQLAPTEAAWRLHLFGPVADAPRAGRDAVVVVLQIVHALGDGRRTAQIARELFDAPADVPVPIRLRSDVLTRGLAAAGGVARMPWQMAAVATGGVRSYRLARHEEATRRADRSSPGGYALSSVNVGPDDDRSLRVITVDRAELTGGGASSVTTAALTLLSVALPRLLGDPPSVGVELTVGRVPDGLARNNFGNVSVDLALDVDDLGDRARQISLRIDDARRHATRAAAAVARQAEMSAPAFLTRWGTTRFDTSRKPAQVTGNTVVSSVNRGPADLRLGAGTVVFSAGFPALSPVQGLTHGIHGLGDTVAISVTTSPAVLGSAELDRYVEDLRSAIAVVGASVSTG